MSILTELKRRNVFKVAGAYLALGWVVTQVTAAVVPALKLPESINSIVVWMGVAAFPFVVIFSWVFEITPEGIKRESEIDRSQSITHITSRRLDYTIIALLVAAIAMFALDRFAPPAGPVGAGPARDTTAVGAGPARDTTAVGAGPARDTTAVGAGPARDTTAVGAGPARDATNVGAGLPATRAEPGASAQPSRASALPQESSRASALPHQAAPAAPAPDAKSIAVLPFVNMSSDKEQDYFSDGISEELLNLLAKIPQLSVAARTSSFSFKDTRLEITEIAAKLRVAHILEGSVRKSGNKVRVTAQLVRASDGYHLWSETWDRELTDIFAVQDEIAGSVVTQLKVTLLGAAPKSRVTDPKAYTLFLQGRQLAEQFTLEGYEQSNALLKQVLAIDPNYPEALRKLAANCMNQAYFGLQPIDEAYQQAREYVDRALAIDPDYGRGHDGLANIALGYDLDVAAAARHYQRALELDPSNIDIITNAAGLAEALGRLDLAVAMMEHSTSRDPVNALQQSNSAFAYRMAGRYDEAIAANRTVSSLSPGFLGAHAGMGWDLLLKGDNTAALDEIRKETSELARLAALAAAQHALGQRAESDAALEQLIAKYEKSAAYLIASALAFRGDTDRAFEWLEKAAAYHDTSLYLVGVDPVLASLHADPRWPPFLRKLGLAPEQVAAVPFEVTLPP